MKLLLLLLTFTHLSASAKTFDAPTQVSPLVDRVQRAYLIGDNSGALNSFKQAYMESSNDVVAQKNLIQLFKKMEENSNLKGVNVGWALPSEISAMRISVTRRLEGTTTSYQMVASGEMQRSNEFVDFQIIRYPDSDILNMKKKLGRFTESIEGEIPEFNYRSQPTGFLISSGLYLIRFETRSGAKVDGWFVLDDEANATTSPIVENFDQSPTFSTGTPKIEWRDFVSPQFKRQLEKRALGIWVGRSDRDEGVWNFWSSHVERTSTIIGAPISFGSGWSHGPLEPGDYYALLNYQEYKEFGPIRIIRRSSVAKPFSIRK